MINNSTYTRKLICNLCYHTYKMLRYQTTASHVRFCHQSSGCDVNDEILIEKFGKITTIAINRPEKRNCVNRITANKLTQAIHEFESDDSAYVGILYGKGGNFCAGFDLEELSNIDENTDVTNCEPGIGPMGPTRSFIKKPLIAAISGYAVAGGLELALLCDMRVVEETARLGVLCRRFGVPLIDGGTVRLPALIGLSRALDLILTGRIITGQEAHDFGLCNMLVACGTGLGQAMNLAGSLVKFPQECLLADRKSVYNSVFSAGSLQEALEFEKTNAEHVINKESIEGAKKFVSGIGRHGRFTGLSNISYDFK